MQRWKSNKKQKQAQFLPPPPENTQLPATCSHSLPLALSLSAQHPPPPEPHLDTGRTTGISRGGMIGGRVAATLPSLPFFLQDRHYHSFSASLAMKNIISISSFLLSFLFFIFSFSSPSSSSSYQAQVEEQECQEEGWREEEQRRPLLMHLVRSKGRRKRGWQQELRLIYQQLDKREKKKKRKLRRIGVQKIERWSEQ